MPRNNRRSKGILGVPKKFEKQIFAFGRYAEPLPSDESDDPDFNPEGDQETATSKAGRLKNKERPAAEKKKVCKDRCTVSNTGQAGVGSDDVGNSGSSRLRGWSEAIPTEILLLIFQYAIEQLKGSSVPFLCRMSRVCCRWRDIASEPRLWKTVNLSTSELNITTSATILQKLASSRIKFTRVLFLRGWSKLTDKGIEIDIPGLQCIVEKLGAQLECLCLQNCTRLTGGRILPLIQENCPNLRELNLTGTNIRTFHIEKLQAGCPKLQKLFLSSLQLFSAPKTNEKKGNGFPELVDMNCSHCGMHCQNDNFLNRILCSSNKLESLNLAGHNQLTVEGFSNLPDCPLKTLKFGDASYSTLDVVVKKWHATLESLDIGCSRDINDDCMLLLSSSFGMPKLRELNVSSTNITDAGLRYILNACLNLEKLNLTSCRGLPRTLKKPHLKESIESLRKTQWA
ncbi:F-box/LRR-repeat protein 6-like isoform X2 [Acropora millepora]|uniref:F-box/LRR-repeat protein 6-like isoform X2 n=1 Tax=Acropora millepora TaxID=45264 RepID=UPI001CF1B27D|nr:F-box/LRR-repeat protein 6-like isoform X2 [Acropora millepora]